MTNLEQVIAGAIVVIVIAVFVSMLRIRATKQKLERVKRDQWIVATLLSITNEANRKRLNVHAQPKIDVAEAFNQLRSLTGSYPASLTDRINEMEARWKELSSQLAEFTDQSASTTLQSSILTSKTSKLANDLGRIADEIEKGLEY